MPDTRPNRVWWQLSQHSLTGAGVTRRMVATNSDGAISRLSQAVTCSASHCFPCCQQANRLLPPRCDPLGQVTRMYVPPQLVYSPQGTDPAIENGFGVCEVKGRMKGWVPGAFALRAPSRRRVLLLRKNCPAGVCMWLAWKSVVFR